MLDKEKIVTCILLVFFIDLLISSKFERSHCMLSNVDELDINIQVKGIRYNVSTTDVIYVYIDIDIIFLGNSPPKTVVLSLPLENEDPNYVIPRCIDLVNSFGPWINIREDIWGLQFLMYNKTEVNIQRFTFILDNQLNWPNEKYKVKIFAGYTNRTLYGDSKKINSVLACVNSEPETVSYYFLNGEAIYSNMKVFYKGDKPTPDDIYGNFYNLILSHDNTVVETFNYMPSLLNVIFPIIIISFLLIDTIIIFSVFKLMHDIVPSLFLEINVNYIIMPQISLLVFLLTLKFWIKDFIPPHSLKIFTKMNLYMQILSILFVISVLLSTIKRSQKSHENHSRT